MRSGRRRVLEGRAVAEIVVAEGVFFCLVYHCEEV